MLRVVSTVTLILAATAIGAVPYELQRMVVRFMQPFFLSGIILIYYIVINSTTNISLFFGILCMAVAYLVVRYVKDGITERNQQQLIRPMHTTDDEVFLNADSIIDFTSKAIISSESVEASVDCKDDDLNSISPDSIQLSEASAHYCSSDYGSVSDDNESFHKF